MMDTPRHSYTITSTDPDEVTIASMARENFDLLWELKVNFPNRWKHERDVGDLYSQGVNDVLKELQQELQDFYAIGS